MSRRHTSRKTTTTRRAVRHNRARVELAAMMAARIAEKH
jgi:hypothetical protein